MAPSIVTATVQSAGLGVLSCVLAQSIKAWKDKSPLLIDWIPVFQYLLFLIASTPPNYLCLFSAPPPHTRQEFLESCFPSYPEPVIHPKQTDDKPPPPMLSKRNTVIKFVLDQSVGATVNTLLFSTFTHSLRMASSHAPRITNIRKAVDFWVSPHAIDFSIVDFDSVWAEAKKEFWPLIFAGAKLWPFVSLINFTLVKSVQGRNLVGAMAGVVWGIYICLVSGS